MQLARRLMPISASLCLILFALSEFAVASSLKSDIWQNALDSHTPAPLIREAATRPILEANTAAVSFYGYPMEQLVGMDMQEFSIPPPQTEQERLAAPRGDRKGFIFPRHFATGSIPMPGVDSSSILHRSSLLPSSIASNIASQRAEQELLKQNARLRRAEMITGLGSWELYLPEGRITLSEGARQILGWPTSEHSLEESDMIVLPEYRQMRQQALRELVQERNPYDIEFVIRRPSDGKLVDIHSLAEYNKDTDTVFGTILDITDWKRQEEALTASKQRNTYSLLAFAVAQLCVILLLVANIRQRKKSAKETQQNLRRNESLVRILQHQTDSVQELVDYALQESIKLTESQIGYVFFYDDIAQQLTLNAWSKAVLEQCHIKDRQTVYDLDRTGIWGEAIRQGKAIIVNEFEKPDPRKKGYPPGHVEITKYMTIPIYDHGRIVATIGLANKDTDYDEMDVWQTTLLMGNVWSMVERKRNEIALKEEKERLKATLLSVGDGVITTDENGRVEIINAVAQRLTGWSESEARGRPFEQVYNTVDEETWEKQDSSVRRVLHSGITLGLMNHTILLTKDGDAKHVADSAAPIKSEQGQVSGAVLVFRDVTEEKARAQEIEYLSYHDQLTGLYNRRFLERALKKLDNASNLPISVVMADLNGLKLINDTLGHATGDKLLRKAAEVITANCRDSDIIARWGGDEFIVLLPRTDSVEAEIIVSQIERSLLIEQVESLLVSMSFGWATKTGIDQEIGDTFKIAENNMYRAKLVQSPGIRSETIDALMATLFEKNQREEEHSQRVSELCQIMGRALGLSDLKVKELRLIGLFHDIGKIAVDESTLNKVAPLTEDEWRELRRHPEVGYRLLSAVQDMQDIASFVLSHHERWDGKGYPKGLKGKEIPLESRITGVADAYDAMVSYRPYRKALSKAEAIEELRRHTGTQFDPHLTEVFIGLIEGCTD